MNKQQRRKFHRAIEDISDILDELNVSDEVWELRYDSKEGTFSIGKYNDMGTQYETVETDNTYFPSFDITG